MAGLVNFPMLMNLQGLSGTSVLQNPSPARWLFHGPFYETVCPGLVSLHSYVDKSGLSERLLPGPRSCFFKIVGFSSEFLVTPA